MWGRWEGELSAEVFDDKGNVIAPFSKENCAPIKCDSTTKQITWQGANDLAKLAGKPARFRFHLKGGRLYAFWVSPDASGASHGYVAADGFHTGGAVIDEKRSVQHIFFHSGYPGLRDLVYSHCKPHVSTSW